MGNWNINIQGVGPHHNSNNIYDANSMARGFVRQLQHAGHVIEGATFTYGSKENILSPLNPGQIEAEAARLYTAYSARVGGKAFNGYPLPEWCAFAEDGVKQVQAEAWRAVARESLMR